MASSSVAEIKPENELDSPLMNKMLYALGRLKFSMRTLSTMNHQMAMHPTEDAEIHPDSDFIQSLKSHEIMENIMKETNLSGDKGLAEIKNFSKEADGFANESYFFPSLKTHEVMENIQKETKLSGDKALTEMTNFAKEVDDLMFAYEKMADELDAIRSRFQSEFSKKS